MDMLWYHWMILGLVLGLLELMITSFYVVWFALGALLVGLIVHSDKGSQYFFKEFRKLLLENKCRQSMTSVDNPYENPRAESFWVV